MPTYVIRPTSFVSGGATTSWGNVTSNAQMTTYLGDNLDTTYATRSASTAGTTRTYFGLGAPSIAAGEFVAKVSSTIRWKGGGSDAVPITENLGVLTYRSTDAAPTTTPTFAADGRTTITTTDVSINPVDWSVADCAALRIALYDYKSNAPSLITYVYELSATLYTLAPATTAVSNLTITTANKPTIPVVLTMPTYGWEATEGDTSAYKRVVVEVRIESGGTGVGTGTLVNYQYNDIYNASSGTQNVLMPNALANGTYKVYSRATRFRAGQGTPEQALAVTEQQGTWSAVATLTMNNPLPTAPTFTATADQVNDRATLVATPITTTGFTSPTIEIQRSSDGGTTWTAVRNATNIAGTFGSASTFYDYEAPRNVALTYRARVTATYTGGYTQTSTWTTPATIQINVASTWNLKVPTNPTLNVLDAQIIDEPNEELTEDIGVFRPMDRRLPVIVAGSLGGWDGNLTIITTTDAEWAALKTILEAQQVLYLESAFGWAKYIRITSGAKATLKGSATQPRRTIEVDYVEVQAP